MVIGEPHVDERFNELRAIEAEVRERPIAQCDFIERQQEVL